MVTAAFDVQVGSGDEQANSVSIFPQLLADEVVLTKRQMHMPVNGTGRGFLIEAVQHGFQDILTGLKCSLVLFDGTVIDDLDKELRLLTPTPPFVSFRVSLDELVVKHGVQRLAEVFHEVEVFREAALSSIGDAGENIPHFEVLEVVVKADTPVLCECRFNVPNDGPAKLLCESVQEHFGSVLKEIESYGLFAMSGERVPDDCVLLRQMPGVKAFVFQIPLKKLRERFSSEELLKVFREAECFEPSPIDSKQKGAARCRPNVLSSATRPLVSPEIEPRFPGHGAGNRGSISGKTPPPEIGAQFGPRVVGIEPAAFRLQACAPPTRPDSGGQRGHHISICYIAIASGPSKSKIQTPNGPWILDFGVWILEFGVWSLDFGFWILDLGFWILEFGVWILDFGSV